MIAEYRGVYTRDLPLPGDALARFFEAWRPPPLRIETVALDAAAGRVLARGVIATADVPEFPRSAMDGFALRAADVRDADPAAPCVLTLAGEVRPGARSVLPDGCAVRVATGAPLPIGADCVVRVEDVAIEGGAIRIARPVEPETDVVAVGEDIPAGKLLAAAGIVVNAATVGLLASLGQERVEVLARPTVAVISTGDEVVPIAATPRPGEVRNSNAVALMALLRSLGAEPVHVAHVRDDVAELERTLAAAVVAHDAVVMSGGSSVGARDFTRAALAKLHPGVVVHGVRMVPGRPVLLAASGTCPVLGLPGNPTSAMLVLLALGAPIFAKLTGRPGVASTFGTAAAWLVGKPGWASYVPVRVDAGGGVFPIEHACSTFITALVDADGYVCVAADRTKVAPGEPVRVHRLP